MDKTAIRNFAVKARRKLIEDITHRAYEVGITKDKIRDIETFEGGFRVKHRENGKTFKKYELKQRDKLIQNIEHKGFGQVVEEVAYTWFNRFIALRFMEVNNYLPTGVRVLSSVKAGKVEPDIIKEALNIDLDIDREVVFRLQDSNDTEDLYKYLLVGQCNQLGKIMPSVFEEIADYTELLLPDKLLAEGSVIRDLVEEIEEYDWKIELKEKEEKEKAENKDHGIEIIGWLYQYYISEKKDEVFAGLKKNKKITKENIPAATQLFTPKWIVKYMVENSLGRLWLERLMASGKEVVSGKWVVDSGEEVGSGEEVVSGQWLVDSGEEVVSGEEVGSRLKDKWKYYLDEAKQEPEVEEQLRKIRAKYKDMTPEDIKVLDPAMGSGHILVYAFDVLYDIYLSEGYSEREIPTLILENNLYGLDIDDRAGQLASFALLMKARSKNRRIFRNKPKMNLCSIQESNFLISSQWLVGSKGRQVDSGQWLVTRGKLAEYFVKGLTDRKQVQLKEDFEYLLEVFYNAKEYGSILEVKEIDFEALEQRIEEIKSNVPKDMVELRYRDVILEEIPPLIQQAKVMSQKYDVVCTNPPYMGRRSMNPKLIKYLDENFKDSKGDLFAVFIEAMNNMFKSEGILSLVTMQSWMFLSSYELLRGKILQNNTIIQLMHMNNMVMRIAFGTAVAILGKKHIAKYSGTYHMVKCEDLSEACIPKVFPKKDERYNEISQDEFEKIPGKPIAYWTNSNLIKTFEESKPMNSIIEPKQGLATADNNRFLRLWHEVNYNKINFQSKSLEASLNSGAKWFPYNKGGARRQWYGNYDYIVNWENDGFEIRNFKDANGKIRSRPQNTDYYFREAITWSLITSGGFSIRYREMGSIHDVAGMSAFSNNHDKLLYLLGLMSTKIANYIFKLLNPTINLQVGDFNNFPVLFTDFAPIIKHVKTNISISKTDWDSFENSWDFKMHPLLTARDQRIGTNKSNHLSLDANHSIEIAFENYKIFTENQFNQLKANEEELNRIFIDIYGLQDELTPEVADRDITITKIFDTKEDICEDIKGNAYILTREDVIKSFISYAVGCMFGRYSLDEEGLIYAGGEISDKWLVVSGQYFLKEVVYRYVSKELSRVNSMVEVNESSGGSLQNSKDASPGRNLRTIRSDETSSSTNSIQHSGGATEEVNQGIHTVSSSNTGLQGGSGNTDFDMYQAEILDAISSGDVSGLVSRGWENVEFIDWKTIHHTLTTNYYNIVKDNIIPIVDGDYFEDDILQRFVEFVQVSFGTETLEENLKYIAETLGKRANETSRQAIRRYFLRDFYQDHVRTYKKRPIYWLFDSGRQRGFKALIYMHRYDPFTVARVRIDYLHSLQRKYEAEINHLDILIDSEISNREKVAARKNKEIILKKIQECSLYDEAIAHAANQRIEIDLDDGVKVNYAKFQGIEIPQGKDRKPLKANLLGKI